MRVARVVAACIVALNSYAFAQIPQIPQIPQISNGQVVRVYAPKRVEGRWLGLRDSAVVLQTEWLQSTIMIADVDSIQTYSSSAHLNSSKTAVGLGLVGASLFGLWAVNMCDGGSCTNAIIAVGAVGGLLGAAAGAVLGGIFGSAHGRWTTVYHRI